jgi:hypothetical protein
MKSKMKRAMNAVVYAQGMFIGEFHTVKSASPRGDDNT